MFLVVKLTKLGGNNFDAAYGIKVTDAGKIYVSGQTFSANMAVKDKAYNKTYGGSGDGFIAKFSADGTIEQITYVGTPEADVNFFLETDEEENVYVLKQLPRSIKVVSAKYRKGDLKMCVFAQSQKSKLKWFFCCCCGTNTPTLICFECIKSGKMANIELDYLIFN